MKMIALTALHALKEVRAKNPLDPMDHGNHKDIMIAPGDEFDTEVLGMKDDEALGLITNKKAKRKTREVADDQPGAAPPSKADAPKTDALKTDATKFADVKK